MFYFYSIHLHIDQVNTNSIDLLLTFLIVKFPIFPPNASPFSSHLKQTGPLQSPNLKDRILRLFLPQITAPSLKKNLTIRKVQIPIVAEIPHSSMDRFRNLP